MFLLLVGNSASMSANILSLKHGSLTVICNVCRKGVFSHQSRVTVEVVINIFHLELDVFVRCNNYSLK